MKTANDTKPSITDGITDGIIDGIIAFESGEATHEDTVALFQRLLDTGTIHHLQGSYQRTMQALIDAGEVTVTSDRDPVTGQEYGTGA